MEFNSLDRIYIIYKGDSRRDSPKLTAAGREDCFKDLEAQTNHQMHKALHPLFLLLMGFKV
jgi:hypothetical protein